ncbi:MAG: glycosyltransferase family 39 protein, partial [Anaerolineae bacterium]|nr:glycosyltransferase family 39 protein [Anaerolineae bacterium]
MVFKRRTTVVILLVLTVLAFLLRVPEIGRPLQGDEYSSLHEAGKLNGFLYYIVLKVWMQFSTQEWWLRLPSIFAVCLTIPISYWIGKTLWDPGAGNVLAAFAATSPFVLDISLQVRHYGFYLAAAQLALAATLYFQRSPRMRRDWLVLAAAFLLLIGSQILGVLLVAILSGYLYIRLANWPERELSRFVLVGAIFLAGLIPILIPEVRVWGWEFLLESIGATTRLDYANIRGIGYTQLLKAGWTFYELVLGMGVYPLNLEFTIPAFLLCAVLVLRGLRHLWLSSKAVLALALGIILIPLAGILLVFEPLVPAFSETVSPKHLAMVWPAIALLLVAGTLARARRWLFAALILMNVLSVNAARSAPALGQPDWRELASWADQSDPELTLIINDGRSIAPLDFYFSDEFERAIIWDILQQGLPENIGDYEKVLFFSNDFQPDRRFAANTVLSNLISSGYQVHAGYVRYPLFHYELVRDDSPAIQQNLSGQLSYPFDIYGIEFQDLALPIVLQVDGAPVTINGAVELQPGLPNRVILLGDRSPAAGLVLVSNVLDFAEMQPGEIIATLQFKSQ